MRARFNEKKKKKEEEKNNTKTFSVDTCSLCIMDVEFSSLATHIWRWWNKIKFFVCDREQFTPKTIIHKFTRDYSVRSWYIMVDVKAWLV